jgi:hypothetical protein
MVLECVFPPPKRMQGFQLEPLISIGSLCGVENALPKAVPLVRRRKCSRVY